MDEKIFFLGNLGAIEVPIRWRPPGWFSWNLEGHWVVHYEDGDILEHRFTGEEKELLRVFNTPKEALIYIEETREY